MISVSILQWVLAFVSFSFYPTHPPLPSVLRLCYLRPATKRSSGSLWSSNSATNNNTRTHILGFVWLVLVYEFSFCNDIYTITEFLINSKYRDHPPLTIRCGPDMLFWQSRFLLQQLPILPLSTCISHQALVRIFFLNLTNEFWISKPSYVHVIQSRAMTSISPFPLNSSTFHSSRMKGFAVDNLVLLSLPIEGFNLLDSWYREHYLLDTTAPPLLSRFDQQGNDLPLLYERFVRKAWTRDDDSILICAVKASL